MTKIIRFVGNSGSGKTTLIAAVVRQLVERSRVVAVIKHAHHAIELDCEGKDSFVFHNAGARVSALASPGGVAVFETAGAGDPLETLARRLAPDVDIVLAEGFHDASSPYFRVIREGDAPDARPISGEVLGEVRWTFGDPLDDVAAGVAGRIVSYVDEHAEESRLEALLEEARAFHGHLCPGQVLGVRLAVLGAAAVGLPEPRGTKSLVVWVEIDRCAADAIQTVTGCRPGKRTLKLVDHGKLAATFLNTQTGAAVRVVARADSRERAAALYPQLERKDAQIVAYRSLPADELFDVQPVSIELGEFDRPGKPAVRVLCTHCAEEVNDNRHVDGDDGPLCRACAGQPYYVSRDRVGGATPW